MNRISRTTVMGVAGVLLGTLFIAGCGDSVSSRISTATKAHVRKMAVMYKMYSNAHQFEGPKSADELRAWVQGDENVKAQLERLGINADNFDSFLVSDRSGDEFNIKWGVKSAPMAPPYPVVFEPNAFDGSRHVGMAGGATREVTDDDEYEELWAGKVDNDDVEGADRGS